jgi:hypothetical protein
MVNNMTETFDAIYTNNDLLSYFLKFKINKKGNLTQDEEFDNGINNTNAIEIPKEIFPNNINYQEISKSTTAFTIVKDREMNSNKNRILSILRSSNNIEFLSANDLFDNQKIDKSITIEQFLKQRKNNNINIEDTLFNERYE